MVPYLKAALHTQVTTAATGLTKIPGPDPDFPEDVCYQGAGVVQDNLSDHFPVLGITFAGGALLDLPPSNYLFIHGKEAGRSLHQSPFQLNF